MMIFEWDSRKASTNTKKHHVTFEEASSVFGDVFSVTIPDPDHSDDEVRMLILGQSNRGLLLVVSFCERNSHTRIVSARPATNHERKAYEANPKKG